MLSIFVPRLDEVFVADGLLSVAPHTAEEYWASLVTLEEYRAQEHPTFLAMDSHNIREIRYLYMWPEVLIPTKVAAEHITWDRKTHQLDTA